MLALLVRALALHHLAVGHHGVVSPVFNARLPRETLELAPFDLLSPHLAQHTFRMKYQCASLTVRVATSTCL